MLGTLLPKKEFMKLCRLPSSLQIISICRSNFVHCKGSLYSCVDLRQKQPHIQYLQCTKGFSTSSILRDNAFQRLKGKVSSALRGSSKASISGCFVYEKCVDSVDSWNAFLNYFQLPDTFQSWFLVMQLHVWMCITIMISEKQGRKFRNGVVNSMWTDVELRLEKLATMKSSRRKQYLTQLVEQFQAALISYDEGILANDMVLAASVWRTFFNFQEIDPRLLEKMVIYIRRQMAHLDSLPVDEVLNRGNISFLTLQTAVLPSNKSVKHTG